MAELITFISVFKNYDFWHVAFLLFATIFILDRIGYLDNITFAICEKYAKSKKACEDILEKKEKKDDKNK